MAAPKAPPPKKRISTKGTREATISTPVVGKNTTKYDESESRPLNFKVPAEFKRDFKSYASEHEMTMVSLLMEAFEQYKRSKG